jgi:hypothetical protein
MDDKSLKYVKPGWYDYRINEVHTHPISKLGQIYEDKEGNRYIYLQVVNTTGHVIDDIRFSFTDEKHETCHPTTDQDASYELMNIARPGKAYHIGDCTCFKMISPVYNFGGVAPTPVNVGVKTINTIDPDGDGNFKINPGTNISVSTAANGVTISASGGGTSGVSSVNNITGAVQVQAADSSITVTNSGQNINIKANGSGPVYRYESVSLMTYITNACFSQGISFKDFAINGVPLYHPFEAFYRLPNGELGMPVESDKLVMTFPYRIASATGTGNIGLINTYSGGRVYIGFDVYMSNADAVRRDSHFERKLSSTFIAFKQATCDPFTTGYAHGIGWNSIVDGETTQTFMTAGRGVRAGKNVAEALDMFGYYDIDEPASKCVKSIQLNTISPGTFDEGILISLKIIFDNIYLVRKFNLGV